MKIKVSGILRKQAFFLLLVFLSVLGSPVLGQERSKTDGKSFLWKVRSKSNTLYILGSVHFFKKENYPLHPSIEKAYDSSKKLILEINLESPGKENPQQLVLMKGTNPDGKTFQESVSDVTYRLAEKRARELGIDIRAFSRFKPWFVALTISTVKLRSLRFDPQYGIDKYFSDKARANGKETIGLETFEYQINLFDEMSVRVQERLLLQALKDLDVMEQNLDRIVSSWTAGDVGTVESILLESFAEYPEVYQRLIYDRNQRWLPKVEKYLDGEETCLLIVGAGHLVGKRGVIELLKQRGYLVEQL